jgi:EmrB/QacA subfamily drug resistance transporter
MTATDSRPRWDPDQNPDDPYKWKAFWAVGISMVTMVMSFSIVFLALPSIADDFGVTLRQVSWVVIAQSLTVSAVMLPLGRVADLTGRKRFHLAGLVLFGGGALFSAFSPNFPTLIAARVVMAVGASMGQAVSTAIVTSVFPAKERGTGLGSQSTTVAIGGAAGPIVAGGLLQVFDWPVLFIFMAIPTAIAFVWGLFVLDDDRIGSFQRKAGDRYDWVGAGLSAVAMIGLILTINNPTNAAWTSPLILSAATVTVILFVAFVRWELRVPSPMIDLRLFANPIFRYATLTRLVAFMGSTATFFMMPVFLQSFRGIEEGPTGAIMFIGAVGMGVGAQMSGRLSDRYGFRRFTLIGFVVLICTSVAFGFIDASTAIWVIMPLLFLNGIGMGLWSTPNMSATMGAVPRSQYGSVSAFVNLTRNVGNVTGQAIVATIVTSVMVAKGFDIQLSAITTTDGAPAAFLSGWRAAYVAVVAFAVVALIGAALTRQPKTAAEVRAKQAPAATPPSR